MSESGPDTVETLLRTKQVFPRLKSILEKAWVKDYNSVYRESISDIERFWGGVAEELRWYEHWDKVLEWNYPSAKWFVGTECNIVQNALDRHRKTRTKKLHVHKRLHERSQNRFKW